MNLRVPGLTVSPLHLNSPETSQVSVFFRLINRKNPTHHIEIYHIALLPGCTQPVIPLNLFMFMNIIAWGSQVCIVEIMDFICQ